MTRILSFLLFMILLTSCTENDKRFTMSNTENEKEKNELLLESYIQNDYVKCLEILQDGADGRIDYLKPDCPILFDICLKYLDNEERSPGIEELLTFYLKNRKEAFEDSIQGVHPQQTVGSYLARFASIELLQEIVKEKIEINSPYEKEDTAIFELTRIDKGYPGYSKYFKEFKVNITEKKIRIELLLDAGANVTLSDAKWNVTIFHFFSWYPMEEDYTEILDRMIENGANLFQRNSTEDSCIHTAVNPFTLNRNTEAYLHYVISRGLEVTEEDLYYFLSTWRYLDFDKLAVTEEELRRLEEIRAILEENVKE